MQFSYLYIDVSMMVCTMWWWTYLDTLYGQMYVDSPIDATTYKDLYGNFEIPTL